MVDICFLVAIAAFIAGVSTTLVVLKIIEERALSRPNARLSLADRLVNEHMARTKAVRR